MKIGSSTYSFKRFDYGNPNEKGLKIEDIIKLAKIYGLDGLEILAVQLDSFDDDYLYKIKRLCVENSLDIYALSIHNNFVNPNEEERKNEIEKVKNLIKVGFKLGAPIIRVFGGRWGTIKDFTELMARRGKEPALEGYTYEKGIEWNISAFRECVNFAKEHGIVLAIENHWGLTYSAEGVLDILYGVNSDFFKVVLDCGNFLENTYEQLEKLIPYTILVHAKTYFGGGIFYDFNQNPDYVKIIRMLKNAGYKGYLSIEFEGKANYEEGILASIKLLSQAIKIS